MLSARAYSVRQKSRLAVSLSWVGGYTNAREKTTGELVAAWSRRMSLASAGAASRGTSISWTGCPANAMHDVNTVDECTVIRVVLTYGSMNVSHHWSPIRRKTR